MRVAVFAIKKNELWVSILDGTCKKDASITAIEKHLFNVDTDEPELIWYFYNIFVEILEKYTQESVAYKLFLAPKLDQIPYMHCSIGILNYVCKIKNIPTVRRSGSWITAARRKICLNNFSAHNLNSERLVATTVSWNQLT